GRQARGGGHQKPDNRATVGATAGMPVARFSLAPTSPIRPARQTARASDLPRRIGVALLLAGLGLVAPRGAQAKGFLEYVKPAPIVCSPLSSASWGAAGVLPRDV